MCKLVKDGKIKQIGVSNYGPQGLKRCVEVIESFGERLYSDQVIRLTNT
jgi:diketogulonate reductase-like aldo/keto reductase